MQRSELRGFCRYILNHVGEEAAQQVSASATAKLDFAAITIVP